MLTYEMVGLADENGREYECQYGTYSKENGFQFNEKSSSIISKEGWRGFINKLFHDNIWKLKQEPVKKMSLADIEKELGYRVQIIAPEPKEKEVSAERKKEVDRTVDFFKKYLGIDLDANDYY